MTLTREEMETAIVFNAANRETVYVFSDDPTWQRKLERAGATVKKEHPGGAKEYTLAYRQVSIRKLKEKKILTDEQRQAARERFKKIREARQHGN